MKKILAAAAAVMLCLSAGCGKKSSEASESTPAETSSASAAEETSTEAAALQSAPSSTTVTGSQTTTALTTVTPENTTSTVTTDGASVQPDPSGSGVFSINSDGAVVFSEDPSQQDDNVLITAAQLLFENACKTEWDYTVSCPYELDPGDYVENDFGWQYHRIKSSDITTMDDLRADYHKIFSESYPDQLSELYVEENGGVYALNAARGRDLYYIDSRITRIISRKDDEIVFAVDNNYSGSDFEPDKPVTEKEEFSVVIEDNGTWKVSEFVLPY